MLRIIFLAFAALIVFSTVMTVIAMVVFAVATVLAFAVVVGVPAYLAGRYYFGHQRNVRPRLNPMERLQNLYVEGKIDLFEYERRVAALLAVERW